MPIGKGGVTLELELAATNRMVVSEVRAKVSHRGASTYFVTINGNTPEPEYPVTISVITAHQQSAALMAAGVDLGVFNALGEGPRTAAKLAVKVGVPERGMRIPCDYLACHSQLNN